VSDNAQSERLVLAVDLGSSALKVGVVSLSGQMITVAERALETERLPGGTAVQDASTWWRAVRGLAASSLERVDRERIMAVSCTGQWASTVPTDETGEPVGPCLMWQDTRGAERTRRVVGGPLLGYSPLALLSWIRRTAGVPSPFGGDPVSHMLHLEIDEPEVAARARWYLEPVDYLSMRFSGRAAATLASMSAAWLTDNRNPDQPQYDRSLVRRAGLPEEKLPPLVPTGSALGRIRPEVAAELGLNAEVQVVTGTPDIHSAAVGTGAARDGQSHTTISTSSWVSVPTKRKKTDPFRSIATIPGLDAHSYLVANNQEAAGLCLQWLRQAAPSASPLSFEELTAIAATAPAGSNGVIFTPWIAGERSPVDDRDARGGWHNLSVQTTSADLVRAVLEGVAYNTRWLHQAVERFVARRLDPVRIFGGGAVSDLWCQIHADVLDRTIERVFAPLHANLRGAALFAGLALGDISRDEIPTLVPVERVFIPAAENRATYDRLYSEFPRLYKSQRAMFKRLHANRERAPTN
jgi:xylulokinase